MPVIPIFGLFKKQEHFLFREGKCSCRKIGLLFLFNAVGDIPRRKSRNVPVFDICLIFVQRARQHFPQITGKCSAFRGLWAYRPPQDKSPPKPATALGLWAPARQMSAKAGHRLGPMGSRAANVRQSRPPPWAYRPPRGKCPPKQATALGLSPAARQKSAGRVGLTSNISPHTSLYRTSSISPPAPECRLRQRCRRRRRPRGRGR